MISVAQLRAHDESRPDGNRKQLLSCLPRVLAASLVGAAALIVFSTGAQGQSTVEEYRVKAAFLFHFSQLVEWPAEALNSDGRSFFLCTYGDDPFDGGLESAVEGKQVGLRRMKIRHFRDPQAARQCQVLFVSRDENRWMPTLLAQLGDAPVVTVGESDDFLQQGGVIRFCLDSNKVRFEVNLDAAGKARLKISSRLLMLAKNIVGSQGAKQ